MFAQVKIMLAIAVIFIVIAFIPALATIINVPDDYSTIQAGIDASTDGDTVLVQPDTYVENINFNGHDIELGSLFLTTGDTSFISQTIIDGNTAGSVVRFENGEDSAAIISGFTIFNGYNQNIGGGIVCYESSPTIRNNTITENSTGYCGGGIYCYSSNPTIINNIITGNSSNSYDGGGIFCWESSPTISSNTIDGNSAYNGGGGIECQNNSSPTISDNTISENSAWGNGGAIFCSASNPIIINNTISENYSFNSGGGISCMVSSPTISNNTINGNSAGAGGGISCLVSSATICNNTISENSADYGGGIDCYNSNPTICNNMISGNSASNNAYWGGGGGIYSYRGSSPIIRNNTIYGNSTDDCGGGISCIDNSDPVAVNNILWANIAESGGNEIYFDGTSSISITYSDIQDTLWPGEGNIDADPYFCFSDTAYYWLAENSPCVGAGCDSLGNPDSTVNIGAFGVGCEATDIFENDFTLPIKFFLSQNYPNPFNPTTTISFAIEHPQFVTLKVYDLLGREVRMLIDENRQAGLHNATFDATNLSSGIYFYRLQAGDMAEFKRMVLLK